MTKQLSRRRRVDLRRELHLIQGAVEAARILAEAVATDQLGPERDHRRAPRAITSLLSLVEERLRTLFRAVRRSGDPHRLHVPGAADGEQTSSEESGLAMYAMRESTDRGERHGHDASRGSRDEGSSSAATG